MREQTQISIWPGIAILFILTASLIAEFLGFERRWVEELSLSLPSWLLISDLFFAPALAAWMYLGSNRTPPMLRIVLVCVFLASVTCLDAAKRRFLAPGLLSFALIYCEAFWLMPMLKKRLADKSSQS